MMLSPATLISIPRFSHSPPNIEPTPHSAGNGSFGDLLSTNSVPSINPSPRVSPMIGLPEKALIPSWNLGAISLTCLVIFLSLIANYGNNSSDPYININKVSRILVKLCVLINLQSFYGNSTRNWMPRICKAMSKRTKFIAL
jgi:hypothetical protein